MFIDGNSSNYLKVIDKWQPVVCADVLGEPETGWDYRLEFSTALQARQTIKPFKQFLKGVAIRSRPSPPSSRCDRATNVVTVALCLNWGCWIVLIVVNLIKRHWISNLILSKDFSSSTKSSIAKLKTSKSEIQSTPPDPPESACASPKVSILPDL
jgi:hypothetical protein